MNFRKKTAQQDPQSYKLELELSENRKILPKTLVLKILFPEGAVIRFFPQQEFNIQRDVFKETLSLSISNVPWLQNEKWSFTKSSNARFGSYGSSQNIERLC